MDPENDPDLAREFRLIAHCEPTRTLLIDTDLVASGAELGAAIARSELQPIDRTALLTNPHVHFDIYLEAGAGPDWHGYLEHHRGGGARYYETDAAHLERSGRYRADQLGAVVEARFDQRVKQLIGEGWWPVEAPSLPRSRSGPVEHEQRYATAAAAPIVAAALDTLPRDQAAHLIGARLRSGPMGDDRVEDALWRWGAAWAGEELGIAGAHRQRKAVEHQLRALDPVLFRDYHRRAALGPLHDAMAHACAKRLGDGTDPDPLLGHTAGAGRLLDQRVAGTWQQVDASAVLAAYQRLHTLHTDRGIFLGRTEVLLPQPAVAAPGTHGAVAHWRERQASAMPRPDGAAAGRSGLRTDTHRRAPRPARRGR